MKKVTKTYKLGALVLLIMELIVLGMVGSGEFEFQYGALGAIITLLWTGWCVKILISPTYKMTSVDDPALQAKVLQDMEEHGKKYDSEEDRENLRFGSSIPEEWLSIGKKKFARTMSSYEKGVMYYNTAMSKKGKKGILATEHFIYYNLDNRNQTWKKGRFPLREVDTVTFKQDKLYVNKEYCGDIDSSDLDKIADSLTALLGAHRSYNGNQK